MVPITVNELQYFFTVQRSPFLSDKTPDPKFKGSFGLAWYQSDIQIGKYTDDGHVRIDDSEQILTSHHYLFRHEEMEIFVSEADLPRAIRFLRASIEIFADVDTVCPEEFQAVLADTGFSEVIAAKRGSYVHHYPLFCRRVPPDETLISMTASVDEPMYSISIFTYDRPGHRDAYYAFCSFLAHSLLKLGGWL